MGHRRANTARGGTGSILEEADWEAEHGQVVARAALGALGLCRACP